MRKKVLLKGTDGEHRREITWSNDDYPFPGIIISGTRAFYNVGTQEKGMVGVYEECETHSIAPL